MDGEIFNTVIQRYVHDKEKNAAKLGVEVKARKVIGISATFGIGGIPA
jgi:hypothetical protein